MMLNSISRMSVERPVSLIVTVMYAS